MLKREWGAESNGKLPHLFIASKSATLVDELTMEDLPLGRNAALIPVFAVKDLPLGRTHFDDIETLWSSPEDSVSQIHSAHFHVGAPGIISDLLRSVQMVKREQGAEINGKLPHLFIPSKTATLDPEFAVEKLPLGHGRLAK